MINTGQLVAKDIRNQQNIYDHLDASIIDFFDDSVDKSDIDLPISLYYHQDLIHQEVFKDVFGYIAYHREDQEYVIYFTPKMLQEPSHLIKAFIAHEMAHAVNRDIGNPVRNVKEEILSFLFRWAMWSCMFYAIGQVLQADSVFKAMAIYATFIFPSILVFAFMDARKMRKKEYLADLGALNYVSKKDMIDLLETCGKIYQTSKIINFYSYFFGTHPSNTKRIENIKQHDTDKKFSSHQ